MERLKIYWHRYQAVKHTVGKDDVGNGKKSEVKIIVDSGFNGFPWMLDTDSDHSDHNGRNDANKRY